MAQPPWPNGGLSQGTALRSNATLADPFFENPILNASYEPPQAHHHLDADGQPTDNPPIPGRRRPELITPVPKPGKKKAKGKAKDHQSCVFKDAKDLTDAEVEYNPTPIINEIRQNVDAWRRLPNPNQWQVSPATARLLQHWRHHAFTGIGPFFCQVEAVETMIWPTEAAQQHGKRGEKLPDHVKGANLQANPELLRLAVESSSHGQTQYQEMHSIILYSDSGYLPWAATISQVAALGSLRTY